MTKIIMHGCNGRMGKVIAEMVENDPDAEIVAGIDIAEGKASFPIFTDINACDVEADAIIDFSSAKAVPQLLKYATEKKLPVVLCTTGLSAEQLDEVREVSKNIAILKSANMSMGINTIIKLLKDAANVFVPAGYDVEIVEQHHNQKLDAPSGTALALADAINDARNGEFTYVYDRSQVRQKRDKKELGISAVRAGNIPGTHEVFFAGPDELIEIKHIAYSRSIFANGAINAAKFITGKKPGMYDMSDVIANML
ncbi:MAG: 4-hydroxy-tetrahydrodipicolinate reductase [Eubacterium sp.]|nr:4-hydroxy-tetrahydrodipicolinate reductase [Eubacterium sp.]